MACSFDLSGKKIWVAGHRGMVGAAILRQLEKEKDVTLLTISHKELDLRDQAGVNTWVKDNKPDVVFLAAAKVGGIMANSTYPADFIYDNLAITTNIIHAAWMNGVQKLVNIGSSCIYPKFAPQPIKEDSLLSGPLEPTNEYYALAKIAGIKMCQAYRAQYGADFIALQPCNLYGPGDTYHGENSHVIPAMILKFQASKDRGDSFLELWGTGTPLREFLFVDDLAEAAVFLCKTYSDPIPMNVGFGTDLSIRDLAHKIAAVVGYKGEIRFNPEKPDGTPKKLLDVSRLEAAGWKAKTSLDEGLKIAYQDYLSRIEKKAA
jgi:GDP-L-fucose synthase